MDPVRNFISERDCFFPHFFVESINMEFIFIRSAFLIFSSFTFLNTSKIFDIPLHFPWLVPFLGGFVIWIFWEKIYKKRFDFPMVMGSFFLFQLYADTLGNTFKLYAKFNWYDRLTHLTGGAIIGAFAIFILSYFNKKNQWKMTFKSLIIFAIAISLSLGVLYELWEYFAYSVLGYKYLIIGEVDTVDDLLFDLIGATTSVILLTFILKKKGYFLANSTDTKTK